MSRQRENSHNFTQDPLDVSSSPEHSYSKTDDENEKEDVMTDLDPKSSSKQQNNKKFVSIAPPKPARTESAMLLNTRPAADSMVSDNENTPLLHPCSSLPTVVGYDEIIEDYPGPSTTTRSEIGRNELKKKRRKRPRYNTISVTTQKTKPRPLIISPFMPISTQFSIEPPTKDRTILKSHYGSTNEALLSKSSTDESATDEEESGSEENQVEPPALSAPQLLKSLTSREILTLVMLCLSNLCSTVAFSCIAPFYPIEAKLKNLTETETGIVFGVFEFTMFVVSPIFGKFIMKVGAKRMFCIGLAVTGVTAIMFGFLNFLPSGPLFFWASVVVRILEAIGDAAFVTSSFAISAKNFPRNIAMIVGFLETFAGLGYTAGPVIGGILYDVGGFQAPFLALGLVLMVATGLACYLIEDKRDHSDNKGKGMIEMLKIPDIWVPISGTIACAVSLSFLDPTLTPHLESFKLSSTQIGLMFLLCGGVYTATAPIFGGYVDKYHCGKIMMILGSAATIASMVFIGPSPVVESFIAKDLWVIGISLALLGVAASALYIPCFQTCLDIVKSRGFEDNFHTYGCVSGIFQAAFGFGSFVGPTFGSILMESVGFPWTTTSIAVLHILLLGYFISTACCKKANSLE